MCGLSDAIVGLVSAILGGEELSLTSGLFLSWTCTTPISSEGEAIFGTTVSAAGGEVETIEELLPGPLVNKPLLLNRFHG